MMRILLPAPFAWWIAGDYAIPALVLVAGLLVLLLIALVRRADPKRVLTSADAALAAKKYERAIALYRRAATIVDPSRPPNSSPTYAEYRRRAYLGLGTALASANRLAESVDVFKKAKAAGAELPREAQMLVAEYHAESNDRGEEAFDAYLAYLEIGSSSGTNGKKVYALAQQICEVQETMKAAERKSATERNRRVIASNPGLEWAHYYLGLASLLEGHIQEALSCFLRAQKLNPDRSVTAYWLGVCYLQQQEPDLNAAIPWMDRFLAASAGSPKAIKRQGSAAFEIGKRLLERADLPRAIFYLEEATSRGADNPEYNYNLGRALSSNGDLRRALEYFGHATRLDPEQKTYAYSFGVECERAGLLEEAAMALRRAVKSDDAFAEAHGLLASVCLSLGDNAAAALHSRRFLQLRPNESAMSVVLIVALYRQNQFGEVITFLRDSSAVLQANDHPEAVFATGHSYLRGGDSRRAIEWLKELAGEERADYYRACALAHDGHSAEAISLFSAVVERGGGLATSAMAQRGHVLLAEGRFEEATRDYAEVLNKEPTNVDALHGMGFVACAAEKYEDAFTWLSRAAETGGAPVAVLYARALVAEKLGRLDLAAAEHEQLIADPTRRAASLLRLVVIECRRGNYDTALKWCSSPDGERLPDPILFYKGVALLSVGKIAEAIDNWTQLSQRHPDDERLVLNLHRARYLLGAQLASGGQLEDAIAAWNTYLEAYPADEKTSRDLAALHFRIAWKQLESSTRDVPSALDHIEQALGQDPENPRYLLYSSLCDLSLSRFTICEERLRKLLAVEPTSRAYFHLALCLLKKGDGHGAMSVLEHMQTATTPDDYTARAAWLMANEEIKQGRYEEASRRMVATL